MGSSDRAEAGCLMAESEAMCGQSEPMEISNPVLKALIEPGTPVPVLKFLYLVFFLLICCSISLFWTNLGIFHCCMVLFLSTGLICSVTWFLWEFRQENGVGVDGVASLGMGNQDKSDADAKKNE